MQEIEIGIAVVGAGEWGRNHVRVWRELGNLRVVCDTSAERLADLDAPVDKTSELEQVLERDDVTAVVVATPASTHARIAVQALGAGKDVLVEKPMALSVEEAEEIAATARAHGAVLGVGHVLEFHPAVLKLHELLSAGELGEIRYLYSHRLNLGRVRIEENALWSFAPHDIALMLRLMGHLPSEVTARGGAYLNPEVADVTLMSMSFPNDVMAHIFVSWLHPYKVHRFVVVGSEQMADFDDTQPWPQKLRLFPHDVEIADGQVPTARRAEAVPVAINEREPLKAECESFRKAVATRTQPINDADTGIRVLRVLAAGQASLAGSGALERP